jgi:hypothetical protein
MIGDQLGLISRESTRPGRGRRNEMAAFSMRL